MTHTAHTEVEVLFTVAEVARRLRCSDETIRRRVRDGSLAAVRLGRVTRIPTSELDRLTRTAADR